MAAKENPNSWIYAFEPFPDSFNVFKENIELNALQNVKEFQLAIGATAGEMTLATTGNAAQHTTTQSTISGNATSQVQVQSLSLEDVFHLNHLEYCDYLKIDCEGCEFEILLNASPIILNRIHHICRIRQQFHLTRKIHEQILWEPAVANYFLPIIPPRTISGSQGSPFSGQQPHPIFCRIVPVPAWFALWGAIDSAIPLLPHMMILTGYPEQIGNGYPDLLTHSRYNFRKSTLSHP